MPQFLERRFNSACRYIFASVADRRLYRGDFRRHAVRGRLSLQSMLGMDLTWAIVFFGVTTGAYTIYGGLTSAAWTDFCKSRCC